MILYFAKHPIFDLIGTASTSQTDSIYFSDDGGQEGEYRSVAGGYRSYSATVYFQPNQSTHVKEMTAPGNYILYKDHNGESIWSTILTCEHDPMAGCDTITAEDASMDLINETVGAYSAPKAMTIADYINLFVTDSGFEIGVNEIPTLSRTLKWESEEATALNRILSVATQFDAELSFRFEISGLTAVKKYIDIHKHIGRDRRTELTVDSQLNNLVTSTDVGELYTSVYATGATPEGTNQPINLKGYSWTDPDGRFVLKSDGSLRDPVANQLWSRLPAEGSLTSGFINRVKTYDAQTQATLLQSALSDLKQHNHPAVTYTVDIAILPDDVQVGDTVHLRDEQEQLFLTARVLELRYSYSAKTGTATLGDYLIESSEIDPQYRALAEELAKQNKGKDGVGLKSSIVTYQAGTSGTTAPTGTWSEAIPTVSPSQFLWSRTVLTLTDGSTSTTYSVGKIGDNGVPGADGTGIKSSTVTYQIGTSGTTAPTGTWSLTIPPASQGTYLWSRTVTLYTDGNQNTSYSVAYQGINGPQGDQGLPGVNGTDGRTTYAHFAYANSQDGNTDFSTTDSNRKYIGFYSDFTSGDSTNPSDYNWSMIKGADGADGKDGVPGKPGADGRTPYFHIAYADSSDGNTNFSLDIPGSRKYIGNYTDFTQADSNSPSAYHWQLVQGPKGDTGKDGVAGKDGVGIKSTQIMYAQSTSGTTAPTTGWTAQVPTLIKGQYLWTQTTWVYTDNTGEAGYTVSYNAKDGNTGTNGVAGKDGVGIKSTSITYATSTSGTSAPTSGWVSTPPATTAGKFMWTRTIWTYTDNTTETGYSVGKIGEKGATGETGATGPQGERGKQIFKSSCEYGPNTSGHWWSDLSPTVSVDNPPKIGDTIITPAGNIFQIASVNVGGDGTGGGLFGVGDVLGNIKGPQGPAGNDITSYASGLTLPSTVAPANSQFWLVDNNNVAIKFYKSTGTAWVEQQISASAINAATFNGLSFNGVTFNGSTFNSTFSNVQPDGFDYKVHGDSTLSNGSLVTNAYNDSNVQVSHTEVNQSGLLAQGFISGSKVAEISLREGQLLLGATYKASSTEPDRWTSSALDAETIFQLNQTGKLLWSGKTRLGDGQSITPSLPMTSCLNGWKIGIAVDAGNRFSWFHLSKEKALESPGLGHTIPIFDFNSGGGGMYLHVSNTNLYGDTSVNFKGVASGYYIYEIRAF